LNLGVTDPLLGRVLSRDYELVELLGKGGMSRVYRARQIDANETVAVKILFQAEKSGSDGVLRFEREIRAASRLDHPHIVRPLDFGEEPDGLFYFVMEYVPGENLQKVIHRDAPLPVNRVLTLTTQILDALQAAHDQGVVHRDIKPANVLLPHPNFVKVCDFGLAKLTEGSGLATITKQGVCVGTPAYMSPEQAKGASVDGRSDIYSSGVIMYRMLSGRHPFTAKAPADLLMMHISQPPPRLSSLVPHIDRQLEDLISWAMEKEPDDRCPSAATLKDMLFDYFQTLADGEFEVATLLDPALQNTRKAKDVTQESVSMHESDPTLIRPDMTESRTDLDHEMPLPSSIEISLGDSEGLLVQEDSMEPSSQPSAHGHRRALLLLLLLVVATLVLSRPRLIADAMAWLIELGSSG
jgi:serine/threonine protein kinase